jgi:hypothetical protein
VKVFGAGLSKTGTTSLQKAFDILGYKTLGFHTDRLQDAVVEGRADANFRVYDDLDAVFDLPVAHFYAELAEAYPDAKFILTLRDEDDWWPSIKNHFAHRPVKYPRLFDLPKRRKYKIFRKALRERVYGDASPRETLYRQRYREHNARVQTLLPPERLLVMNIMQGDGWDKLCGFLDVPKPEQPFPFENKARTKIEQ